MQRWEYLVKGGKFDNTKWSFVDLGLDGWELVAVVNDPERNYTGKGDETDGWLTKFYFKRPFTQTTQDHYQAD
jgi:hypothetical protein